MCSSGRQGSRSGRSLYLECRSGRSLLSLVSSNSAALPVAGSLSRGHLSFRSQPEALDLWKLVRRLFCEPPVRSVAVESSVLHLCRADSAVLQCRKAVLHRRRAVLHGRKAVLHRRRAVLHVRKAVLPRWKRVLSLRKEAVALSAASDLWDICSFGSARAEKAFV